MLDTNIVSEPVTVRPRARVVERLRARGDDCAIAAPVWHELRFGTLRLPPSKKRTRLERYLDYVVLPVFPILPYDQAAAEWHAGERARLEAKGRVTGWVDGQIAAIAMIAGLVLVTANPRHFAVFDGLVVEDWTHE